MKSKLRQKKDVHPGFVIDKDRLLEYSKMSVEARLEWLEEANKFLSAIKDKRVRNKWRAFRKAMA